MGKYLYNKVAPSEKTGGNEAHNLKNILNFIFKIMLNSTYTRFYSKLTHT